jgi:hypothetical protein
MVWGDRVGFCRWWVILVFLFVGTGEAADRCINYIQPVRVQHIKYFGLQYPYWYGVGQLKQESCCRATVTAFDAGQGIAQFMPKTSQYIQSLMGETLNPYNPNHAIKMQAYYMSLIHQKENWNVALWLDYQIYNGGRKQLFNEFLKAKIVNWNAMKAQCQRKKIKMKWGVLDLCEVNYDYSQKVYKYGNQYRRGADEMRYW